MKSLVATAPVAAFSPQYGSFLRTLKTRPQGLWTTERQKTLALQFYLLDPVRPGNGAKGVATRFGLF